MNFIPTYSQFNPPISAIELTYAEAVTLVNNKGVNEGTTYIITGPFVYYGQGDRVVTVGTSHNTFALQCEGLFVVPNYQNDGNSITYEYALYISNFASGYTIDPNTIYIKTYNTGFRWNPSYEGAGYNIGVIITYGGIHYLIVDDAYFNGDPPPYNSNSYLALPAEPQNYDVEKFGYLIERSSIEYDFKNHWLQKRTDARGNIYQCGYFESQFVSGGIPNYTSFQWGNDKVYSNIMVNSFINCITSLGNVINGNVLTNSAKIDANFINNVSLTNCIFENSVNDLTANSVDYVSKILCTLPEYANRTAALAGNLITGMLYSLPISGDNKITCIV